MIDTDKYEGHTPAPWEWNDDWCSALVGLPNKDADIYDEDAQTVIGVDTKRTPICGSFYIDEHGVRQEAFPEEQLRNDALRAEDALLIADAPLLLEEVERHRPPKVDGKYMAWSDSHPKHDRRTWIEQVMEGVTDVGYWTWVNWQLQYGDEEE